MPHRDTLVLCYHAVSPTFPAPLSVTPEALADQLALLAGRGYRGVTFSEAAAEPGAPGRRVAITFDDAYRSVLALAAPALAAHDWPATVFAPTDHVGSERPMRWPGIDGWLDGPHADELVPMSWQELRDLEGRGWEIGSHTCSHPRLSRLGDEDLAAELERSRAICSAELGRDCDVIAYPYGDHDDRVVAAAERAGYRYAAALPVWLGDRRPLAHPRVGVYHGDSALRFRLKVSPAGRRLRASRGWARLRKVR